MNGYRSIFRYLRRACVPLVITAGLLTSIVLLTACAPAAFEAAHPEVMDEYHTLPGHKALAVAHRPDDEFTFGLSHSQPSEERAIERALFRCEAAMTAFDVDAECRLFMVNERSVDVGRP